MTAKDFRTWHATVLMAVALGVSTHALTASSAAQTRAVARAYREVSSYLGNTPAICRRSYVDPLVVELFEQGVTISRELDRLGSASTSGLATHGAVEQAVARMLAKHRGEGMVAARATA